MVRCLVTRITVMVVKCCRRNWDMLLMVIDVLPVKTVHLSTAEIRWFVYSSVVTIKL